MNQTENLKLNKYDKAERYLLFYMLRSSEVRRIYKNNKCYNINIKITCF